MARQHRHWLVKWAPAAAAAVALATLLVVAFRPRPILVDTATVTVRPMRVTISEEARTRVREVYIVSAPVTGRVLRSPLRVGDVVAAGETTLAVIEEMPPTFIDARMRREIEAQIASATAAVGLAEAEVRQATAELTFAGNELTRAQSLARKQTVPARTVERTQLDHDARQAALARANAALEVRRRDLDSARARLVGPDLATAPARTGDRACCVTIVAPVSGRVLKRIHDSEAIHLAGSALIELGNVENLEIVAELLSTDAVRLREGARASVDGWGGEKPLAATVRRIEPSGFTKVSALGIEEQRVRVVLDIEAPLAERSHLGHDYRVVAHIEQWSSPSATVVPLSALFRRDGQWVVFTIEAGRARVRPIDIGHRNNETAELLSGLATDATVILHPSDKVTDGVRVSPRPQSSEKEQPLPAPVKPTDVIGRRANGPAG